MERLEAEVIDLRKQVLWGQGKGNMDFVYWEKERGLSLEALKTPK